MFTTKKIARVSVINDLVTDSRVNKVCLTLLECGYRVELTGRKLPSSLDLPDWHFSAVRMKLLFKRGPLFYFFFNVRLFFRLLFKRSHLLYANDLDTLLPNFLVSRLKATPLIYDSHELFCEVPELRTSKVKRAVWKALERWVVPKLNTCITVNESIALIFEKEYKVKFRVVRNIPALDEAFRPKTRLELGLPPDKKIILLQGSGINVDRGAEELIDAMYEVPNALLLVIGGGDVWPVLQEKVRSAGLESRVTLIDKLPKPELLHYTYNADIGVSIDKNTNLNYYYSLPNKIFDYIHAELPILASRLPEIEHIVSRYSIGDFITGHSPGQIALKLSELLLSPRLQEYKANTRLAKKELNWESEKLRLIDAIENATL